MRLPRSNAARVAVAAVAMIAVAELAVWLLSPSGETLDPAPTAERDYFSPAELERAHDYRQGQRLLTLAGLAIEAVVLVALALGRPAPLRRRLDRLASHPVLGAAAAGAAVALATRLAALPTGLWAHERAVDAGLSSQSLASWLWDVARSAAIGIALTGLAAALLMALIRKFPRAWWAPGTAVVAALAVAFVWIAPVLLAPIFNRFEALPPDSRARAEVVELGERAGVDIGEVYRIDASRRVNSLNAYVDGLGSSKRVVLYDNLLAEAERRELASIVAHELGHVANHDIRGGLLFVVIVAPLGLVFTRELGIAVARRGGADPRTPAAIPAYLLALSLAVLILNVPGNQLSRQVEARADQFALELTDDPRALIDIQRRLARTNLTDPDPPGLWSAVFATHPSTVDRIGAALAYQRGG